MRILSLRSVADWPWALRLTLAGILGTVVGCFGGPEAIPPLQVDASRAAEKAMELHDANGDGTLDEGELATAPGLAYSREKIDSDRDGALSQAEIVAMIENWNEKAVGLLTAKCTVQMGRRPLSGAKIRFEPAPFLEDQIETAIGLTDEVGDALLSIPKEKRPIPDCPPGVQVGLYRVVISKENNGKETVPSKYNSETTLGQEVSFNDPIVQNRVVYKLRK